MIDNFFIFALTVMNTSMITVLQVNGGPIHRRPKKGAVELVKAECEGCGHGLSYHDATTHACHEMLKGAPIKYDKENNPTAHGLRQCTCRQYVGPLPADRMIAMFNPNPQPRGDQSSAVETSPTEGGTQ